MKGIIFCVSLLLAFAASASSIEEAVCRTTSMSVAQMDNTEKLCRSFSRALAALPEAMRDDARAVLTRDPAAFEKWIRKAQRRPLPAKPEEPYGFQRKQAGAEELLVEGGGESVWADGARSSDAHLIDTKYVEKPDTSPLVVGSACDESVRQIIRKKEAGQFSRYAAVILDSETPVVGLEIVVNDSRAIAFF